MKASAEQKLTYSQQSYDVFYGEKQTHGFIRFHNKLCINISRDSGIGGGDDKQLSTTII